MEYFLRITLIGTLPPPVSGSEQNKNCSGELRTLNSCELLSINRITKQKPIYYNAVHLN